MKKKILTLLLIVMIIVFCISGYMLYDYYHQYAIGDDFYDNIIQDAVTDSSAPTKTEKNDDSDDNGIGISIDFDSLLSVNEDTVGWLHSEGTVISYPVVYPSDNSYYLSHLLDGERNKNGTLFVDSKNQKPFADDNTIIYGHHMKSGRMFASLVEYGSQSYYDEHSYLYYITPEANYKLEIISAFVTPADSYAYQHTFETEAEFQEYLNKISGDSDIRSAYKATTQDKLVTLSTCTYEYADARYVVIAKATLMDSNN